MNSKVNPPQFSQSPDYLNYTNCSDIFRSWFWRYYDHLFPLVLYNLGWFLTCFCIGWLGWKIGFVGDYKNLNFAGLYFLYMVESTISLVWAYLIFQIFIEGQGSLNDAWYGLKKYFWKASAISSIFAMIVFLAFYNIRIYLMLQTPNKNFKIVLVGIVFWILFFWLASAFYQWPILFFQNPPISKIFYRSFMLVLGNGLISLGIMAFLSFCFLFFWLVPFLWFFIGFVFFFSFQCVALEKQYLRYKITYGDKPLEVIFELLERERQRGWRDILRPWENR